MHQPFKLNYVQMAMSALYGFFGVCFWSLATPVGSSVPSIPDSSLLKNNFPQ